MEKQEEVSQFEKQIRDKHPIQADLIIKTVNECFDKMQKIADKYEVSLFDILELINKR